MSHSLPGVNSGYITCHRLLDNRLQQQQERISAVSMAAAARGKDGVAKTVIAWVNDWPLSPTSQAADGTQPLALAP